ncbi:hypothetical protein PX967_002579 [Escherichia coli]|nr:hypothetical protein [Escherichia coli]
MKDFPRVYYTLPMAAKKLGCTVDDILHLGATNRLEICAYISERDIEENENEETIQIFLSHDDEEFYLEDINRNNCIRKDMFCIALFKFSYISEKSRSKGRYSSLYANLLNGFFAIPSEFLLDIELSGLLDDVTVKPYQLLTPKQYGRQILIANFPDISIQENRLVVFDSEISNFDMLARPKFPGGERESPKTAAKRNEVIYSLIKLIPEMGDVDLDTESLPKIAYLIDSIAASRGIEFPKTHWQTWQKYLGRESQQKRKK